VAAALTRWDFSSPASSFVFTSSMSVCAVDDGGVVTEDSCPLNPLGKSPSVDRLLLAEKPVLEVSDLLFKGL
jgi:nucleoside-diphosphate-sugar epimerase